MKYKIKIELLSDMCPSSGGTYGSVVDNDCLLYTSDAATIA